MNIIWAIAFLQFVNSHVLDLSDDTETADVGDIVAQYENEFRSENKGDDVNIQDTGTVNTNDYDPEIVKAHNRARDENGVGGELFVNNKKPSEDNHEDSEKPQQIAKEGSDKVASDKITSVDDFDSSDNGENVGDIAAQYENVFRSNNKEEDSVTENTNDYDPEIVKAINLAIDKENREGGELFGNNENASSEDHHLNLESTKTEDIQQRATDGSDKDELVKWANWCKLGPEAGNCTRLTPRFYYNTLTGQCQQFTYTGCFGNRNNFKNLNECERRCKDHPEDWKWDTWCQLQKTTGNCTQKIARYYYNLQTDTCESFIYSGCSGNRNNFGTAKECEGYCKKQYSDE